MKRFFTLLVFFIFSLAQAQTALPYQTGFDNATEQMDWTEYRLGDNSFYEWEFSGFMPYSAPECLSHNYPVGGSLPTDDWIVSPEFDFSSGGVIDSLRYAFSGFGTPMAGDTIAIYLINGSNDPALATTVTAIYSFTDSTYSNDGMWRKIENVTIPAISGQSYLAFRYTTTINWLDVRLDNLAVSGNSIGLENLSLDKTSISLYPNPTDGVVQIGLKDKYLFGQKLLLKLYNITGALVFQKEISTEEQIEIDHLEGIYTYEINLNSQYIIGKGQLVVH